MKKNILVALLLFSTMFSEKMFAQDPQFTQFYANPLYLNPAFAGSARCPRFCFNYRNEWPGLNKTYITYSASYDQHIDAISGGIGLLFTDDIAGNGTLSTLNASFMYSYLLKVTREFSLRFGLQAGYHQKTLDWTKLTFGDMIDRRRGFVWNTNENPGSFPNQTSRNVDVSAGMLGYTKRYFFGVAVNHINQPDEHFIGIHSPLPFKLTVHAGATIPLSKDGETYISPNILYQYQGQFQQLNIGMYFVKGKIVAGLWYRNQDAMIVLVGFQTPYFKVGYSYDVTVSKLASVSAGSHEISLQFQLACKPKKRKFRTISCPSF
ncbi:MAG: type IX secretion system membrane protein PorP/SprF [Bacteroidetes bacterium]|nr:type IX secretion system membrane protein PorP/SprF [Bacteroidota bacterium]